MWTEVNEGIDFRIPTDVQRMPTTEMLQRYQLVRFFCLQRPFLYQLFSDHEVGIVRSTQLVLSCKSANSLLAAVSIPLIANTLGWPAPDGSPPWEQFTVQEIPLTCLLAL